MVSQSGPAEDARFRLVWRETEKSWTPALVAALLGLDLEVDAADEMGRPHDEGEKASAVGPPRHGRARVSGCPGTEVTVEVPTLRDLKLALSFNGLEVPLTHGYRHYRLQPSPPHDNISDAQVPGEDPPLVAQLAPLSTEEILTRLKKAKREDDISPPSKRRKAQAKGAKNKTLAHALAVNDLARAMGGVRPVYRCPGAAPLRPAEFDELRGKLLEELRDFQDFFDNPQRKGVRSRRYLVLKRKAVDDAEKFRMRSVVDVPDRCRSEMIETGNKVRDRARVWSLCEEALRTFFLEGRHPEYDSLAITSDFRGSPHVDKKDTSHQYVLALGDFEGGELCVEAGEGGEKTLAVDVKNRLGRLDGRVPHWVSGWTGERFSLVFFRTGGTPTPMEPVDAHVRWMKSQSIVLGS